jgi:hypothetical protein
MARYGLVWLEVAEQQYRALPVELEPGPMMDEEPGEQTAPETLATGRTELNTVTEARPPPHADATGH